MSFTKCPTLMEVHETWKNISRDTETIGWCSTALYIPPLNLSKFRLSSSNSHPHLRLGKDSKTTAFPRIRRVHNLELEVPQQLNLSVFHISIISDKFTHLNNDFVQLDHRHVFPKALPPPITKNQLPRCIHLLQPTFVSVATNQPSLRSKLISILAPDLLTTKHAPCSMPNVRASWNKNAIDDISFSGDLF